MIRKIINNTASPVQIFDVGVTIPASGSYIIPPVDYGLWEGSANVITKLSDYAVSPTLSTLSANDGTFTLSVNDGVRMIQGGWDTKITDGSDSTIKAKVKDVLGTNRLCVDSVVSNQSGMINFLTSKLRYVDMNANSGGIARSTVVGSISWATVFNYTGSGFVHGFNLNIETKDKWLVRFIVDGEEIFDPNGLSTTDLITDTVYDMDNNDIEDYTGLNLHFGTHDKLLWGFDALALRFNSSVQLLIKRDIGAALKKFHAGLIVITKES